ncbi:MAG: Ig-like domain-containing protein, partial [Fibrobacterota bacterium]
MSSTRQIKASASLIIFFIVGAIFAAQPVNILQAIPNNNLQTLYQANEIQVVFSEPMIPLMQLPQGEGTGPLIIEPSIKGKYRWKGTDFLMFIPDEPLKYATRYKLAVPKGTVSSVTGNKLKKDYQWEFITPVPSVIGHSISNGYREESSLHPVFFLKFNQPIDIKGLDKFVSISPAVPFEIARPCDTCSPYIYVRNQEQNEEAKKPLNLDMIVIKPKVLLQMATEYTLRVEKGIAAMNGGPEKGDTPFEARIKTYAPFDFIKLTTQDANADTSRGPDTILNLEPHQSIYAAFNHSVPLKEVTEHIHITPGIKFPQAYAEQTWGERTIELNQGLEPRKQYDVVFDSALTDEYGNALGRRIQCTFTTGDLNPFVKALTGHGIVEAIGKRRVPVEAVNVGRLSIQSK